MNSAEFLRQRKHVSPKEMAFVVGVSVKTIYNWKNLGKIRGIKLNGSKHGRVRISIEEVERVLSGRPDGRKNEANKKEKERELRCEALSEMPRTGEVLEEDESMYTWRG